MRNKDEDHLNPEDRKILNFMFSNGNMSPREVAKHLGIEAERVFDILARDLSAAMTESQADAPTESDSASIATTGKP